MDIIYGRLAASASDIQEAFLLDGDYHSGPVSSIRCVGGVGLVFFLILNFATVVYAYRMIRFSEGTPFQICCYFIGIPLILSPFLFLFIFGDFKSDLPTLLYSVGLIKMINLSLIDYRNSQLSLGALDISEPVKQETPS